jgi:hypothetical protein
MAPTGWANPFPTYRIASTPASYLGHRFFAALAIAALPAVDSFAFGGSLGLLQPLGFRSVAFSLRTGLLPKRFFVP